MRESFLRDCHHLVDITSPAARFTLLVAPLVGARDIAVIAKSDKFDTAMALGSTSYY